MKFHFSIINKLTLTALAITFACAGAISMPNISIAADASAPYQVLAPLPCIPSPGVICQGGDNSLQTSVTFKQYVQYAINLLIALAAVAAVFMIVYGGFEYMTTDSISNKSEGKKKVQNAIYGLILVLASYIILKTIDPRFVNIPTTLVPQLKLNANLTKNTAASLLDQLQSDAEAYNIVAQDYVNTAKQAKSQIEPLLNKINTLNTQLQDAKTKGDFVAAADIQVQLADTQNQINQITANVAVKNANGIVTNVTSSATNQMAMNTDNASIDATAAKAKDSIAATTETRVDQLTELGALDKIDTVKDNAQYNDVLISIKAAQAKYYNITTISTTAYYLLGHPFWTSQDNSAIAQRDASIQAINDAVSNYEALPNPDPAHLQALKDAQASTVNAIKTATYHK